MGYFSSISKLNANFDYPTLTSTPSSPFGSFYGDFSSYSSYSSYPSLFSGSWNTFGNWDSYKYSYSSSYVDFGNYNSYSSYSSLYSPRTSYSGGGVGSLTGYKKSVVSFAPTFLNNSGYKSALQTPSIGRGLLYRSTGRVTPQKVGKYSRPKKFTGAEAERLYNLFMAQAVKFDPARDLGKDFLPRVKEVARNVKCDYRDLLAIMSSESGLNPYMPSQSGNQAYGFIQFLGGKNQWLRKNGYKPEDLLAMSPVKQLDLVEKFLLDNKKTFGFKDKEMSSGDMYALVFLPAMAKQEVVCYENQYFKGKRVDWYESNKGLDLNGDGKITKTELAQQMAKKQVNERIFAVA